MRKSPASFKKRGDGAPGDSSGSSDEGAGENGGSTSEFRVPILLGHC